MKIAVTGNAGQTVLCLKDLAAGQPQFEILPVGRPELDLADPPSVAAAFAAIAPDVIVNAAAYTAVDRAESEAELAFTVNRDGAAAVASAAKLRGVRFIHISTDYVFSGHLGRPYRETDATGPVNVYGASKLAGESAVMAANPQAIILRTAWLYSRHGANFVKTMLRLAASRPELGVVDDQLGCPTSAADLARAILAVCRAGDPPPGIFHFAGSGETTWCGFARHVFAVSAAAGGPSARVKPITTAEYPTPAARAADTRLDCGRFTATFGFTSPDWRDASASVVKELLAVGPDPTGATVAPHPRV